MLIALILSICVTSFPKTINGFILKETHSFPSLGVTAYLYVHATLGFPFLHIEAQDPHNFFAITFRTTPTDGSGVFHAIHHLVQQGSHSYPVPNLFTELRKRSIATFMNSFFSLEWTTYQFSTTNVNDFFSLLDVHLDAVFHPLLANASFWAECHRYEFDTPNDPTTPLHHSGTLYSETVNAFQKSTVRFVSRMKQELYPDSILRHEFSGLPWEIQKLTVDYIKQMHARYYHPGNALFLHYGSFPAPSILKILSKTVAGYQRQDVVMEEQLELPTKWDQPVQIDCDGPSEESGDSRGVKASLSWVSGDLMNVSDVVDLEFLAVLLTESTVSPLYGGLIRGAIGTRFINTGYFPRLRTPYFSIGLDGFDPAFMQFNETVLALLTKIYENGFATNRVLSLLNQYELKQKTITNSQGYKFWKQIIGSWIHGVHPFTLLDSSWEIERLQRLLAVQPRYFELVMKHRIIDNNHRLDLTMRGSSDFNEAELRIDKQRLREKRLQLSAAEKREIIAIAETLDQTRKSPNGKVHLLPSIEVADLSPMQAIERFHESDNVTIFDSPVNGILSVDIKAMVQLDNDYIEDVPLLKWLLPQLGSGDHDEAKFSVQEQLYTSGFKCDWKIRTVPSAPTRVEACFTISVSALSRNAESLFSLLEQMTLQPDLGDRAQISVVMSMIGADFDNYVEKHAHELVARYSASGCSKAAALEEFWSGFTAVFRTVRLVREAGWDSVALRTEKAYNHVFRRARFAAAIHTNDLDHGHVRTLCSDLLRKLNSDSPWKDDSERLDRVLDRLRAHPKLLLKDDNWPGYITTMAAQCTFFESNDSVPFAVLAVLLQSEFLESPALDKDSLGKMSCNFDQMLGVISFVSIKGRNPGGIIVIFEESITRVAQGEVNRAMIDRAIIQMIARMDQPVAPRDRGLSNFFFNVSPAVDQKRREAVFAITQEALVEAARKLRAAAKRYTILGANQDLVIPPDFEVMDLTDDGVRDL
jgi:Zn-dependent M16 (insulinase) family peptidase